MDRTVQFIPNPRPDVLGKTVQMQFEVSGKNEWFEGIIATYDGLKGMCKGSSTGSSQCTMNSFGTS